MPVTSVTGMVVRAAVSRGLVVDDVAPRACAEVVPSRVVAGADAVVVDPCGLVVLEPGIVLVLRSTVGFGAARPDPTKVPQSLAAFRHLSTRV